MWATFTQLDQEIQLPWGMPAFEIVDVNSLSNFYLNYNSFSSMTFPDFSGDHVRAYLDIKETASYVKYFSCAFPSPKEDGDSFYQCPASFSRPKLKAFQNEVHTSSGGKLVAAARDFQQSTASSWNPSVGDVIYSVFLDLVGIDKAAPKECGAITLGLLLRAGVLEEGEDGSWELTEDYKSWRIYLVDDAKTVENIVTFVCDMQDRRVSFSHASIQADVFMDALSVVMALPGDWHAGLNMAQSIVICYYHGFLEEFQSLLGRKHINKEVSLCYYQGTRLITFVLRRYLIYLFTNTWLQ
jgi:hypothetical protein